MLDWTDETMSARRKIQHKEDKETTHKLTRLLHKMEEADVVLMSAEEVRYWYLSREYQ